MDWTPERIADLTRLWNEGLTTSEIGKRLGISKNAVVGKAHRMHLSARPSPIKRSSRPTLPRPQTSVPRTPAQVVRRPLTPPLAAPLTCSWNLGKVHNLACHPRILTVV